MHRALSPFRRFLFPIFPFRVVSRRLARSCCIEIDTGETGFTRTPSFAILRYLPSCCDENVRRRAVSFTLSRIPRAFFAPTRDACRSCLKDKEEKPNFELASLVISDTDDSPRDRYKPAARCRSNSRVPIQECRLGSKVDGAMKGRKKYRVIAPVDRIDRSMRAYYVGNNEEAVRSALPSFCLFLSLSLIPIARRDI